MQAVRILNKNTYKFTKTSNNEYLSNNSIFVDYPAVQRPFANINFISVFSSHKRIYFRIYHSKNLVVYDS